MKKSGTRHVSPPELNPSSVTSDKATGTRKVGLPVSTPVRTLGYKDAGDVLFNKYVVEETLRPHETTEHGVYRCTTDNQTLILKVRASKLPPNPKLWRQLPELQHANVLRTFEVLTQDGLYIEVQEFCAGGTLLDILRAEDRVEAEWLMQNLVPSMNEGLKYLHSKGIVHRDIKPDNLLFKDDGSIVLGDFDISTALDPAHASRATTTWVGATWAYTAPEALPKFIDEDATRRGTTVSRVGDYYSFGVTLLESLLGAESTSLHQCGLIELQDFYLAGNTVELPREPSRLVMLLQGLLIRNLKTRWGGREVDGWLGGRNTEEDLARIRDDRGFSFHRNIPYKLEALSASNLEELAQLLLEASRNPQLASVACEDLEKGRLTTWINLLDTNIARSIEEDFRTWCRYPSVALYRATVRCDPSLPFPMGAFGKAETPRQWLDNIIQSNCSDLDANHGPASVTELQKLQSWLELSSAPDEDLAQRVAKVIQSPDHVRMEELAFLIGPLLLPYSVERSAIETLRLPAGRRAGARDSEELVQQSLGKGVDWEQGTPPFFQHGLLRWQQGYVDAWARQRGLGQRVADARSRSQTERSGAPPEVQFEDFLRALDENYELPEVRVETGSLPDNVVLPYGRQDTYSFNYSSSGPGIPCGSLVIDGALYGFQLKSPAVCGRNGTIEVELDSKQVGVSRSPHTANLRVERGNFRLVAGSVPLHYRVVLPRSGMLWRVIVGAVLGATILGGTRMLCMLASEEVTHSSQMNIARMFDSVTKFELADGKWILAVAIIAGAACVGAKLWFEFLKKAEP